MALGQLVRVGWRPVRVTDRQIKNERPRIAALLIGLLSTGQSLATSGAG